MNSDDVLQILTGFTGTLGFCVLFHIRGAKLWMAALGGLLSQACFLLFGTIISSEVIRYFIVSVLLTVYAEVLARLLKTPVTTFCMVTLIPLVPGGALYYTMAYALHEDWALFVPKALYTLELSAALSAGILLVTAATRAMSGRKKLC